jgi:orotidine-5'-phosphate decarboxylase
MLCVRLICFWVWSDLYAIIILMFQQKLEKYWSQGKFLCVGLDPVIDRFPATLQEEFKRDMASSILAFNQAIVDATSDLVCAYKPNSAFFEAHGVAGLQALKATVGYIHQQHPDIPVILDAKRGDIGSTNQGYVQYAFDEIGVDAITVHPYLGQEALEPFLQRKEKGIIVLAKTSNPGAGELQDLAVGSGGEPLYEVVARRVAQEWNGNGNCALVVGATYPAELKKVREIVGDMPFLLPGIGAQGGDLESTVKSGQDSRGWGMIIAATRSVIYASSDHDFAEAAREEAQRLDLEIKQHLNFSLA